MSSVNPNTPSSPSGRTRARTLSYRPARACFCRSPTASKQSLTTMEKSWPLTSRSQPHCGRYPILPNPITRGNAASTNTPTAYSDSTSQKVQISLLCLIPRSKGSRIKSTLVPERYSAIELLVRFSSTSKISPLHFAVEWAKTKLVVKRGIDCRRAVDDKERVTIRRRSRDRFGRDVAVAARPVLDDELL